MKLRKLGAPMLSVADATQGETAARLMIPHDGHPSAYSTERIAIALKKLLDAR